MPIMSIVKGMPTDIDVKKLVERYAIPPIGRTIEYAEIAETIGYPVKSNRWLTVVTSWKKRLYREHGILFGTVNGVAFRVLDNHDHVAVASSKQERGMRQLRKGAIIATGTDREGLSEAECNTLDHVRHNYATVKLAVATAPKQLAAPNRSTSSAA